MCHRFYGHLIKSIGARVSGGKDLRSLPKLDDFFTAMYRGTGVDIPRSQIPVADQATWGIWGVHCFIATEGESPGQDQCCPALPVP